MNDINEKLSALFDGELESSQVDEVLESLASSKDLQKKLSSYALIGSAMNYEDANLISINSNVEKVSYKFWFSNGITAAASILLTLFFINQNDFSRMGQDFAAKNKIDLAINSDGAKSIIEMAEDNLVDHVMNVVNNPNFMNSTNTNNVDLKNVGFKKTNNGQKIIRRGRENFTLRIEKKNLGINKVRYWKHGNKMIYLVPLADGRMVTIYGNLDANAALRSSQPIKLKVKINMKLRQKTNYFIFVNMLLALNISASGLPENISQLVDDSAPAVVNITSKKEVSQRQMQGYGGIPDEMLERFGIPRQYRQAPEQKRESMSYGSGFILKDNLILTNYHVVEDATEVLVTLSDRRQYVAEIIGVDPLSDLAVLKVDGTNLPNVKVGNSDELKVGDWVVAIGSPFSFDFSVTAGIVSAKGRSIQNNNIGNYVPFLQTDVAINPGNSGGPLFDLDGNVVGINSQIYSRSGGYQGLAFAIPINVAIDVANQIVEKGEVSRGYLGVRMSEVDNDLADALGMKKPYGALINDVEEGESADGAGLVPGDVIIEFNNKEIKFSSDLPHVVGQLQPDTRAYAKVIRDGDEIELEFLLGELPGNNESFVPAKLQNSSDPLGLKVADIDRDNPSMSNFLTG